MLLLAAIVAAATPHDAIRAAVAARLGVADEDVVVTGAPATNATCTAELPRYGSLTGQVRVTLFCGTERIVAQPYVEAWFALAVAASDTPAGERVPVELRRVSSKDLRGETPLDPDVVWRARTDLHAGDPLTATRVERMPDAERGERVRLLTQVGALRIEAPGELMQDSWVDQDGTAVNLATRTVVRGYYAGDGVFMVEGR